MAKSLATPSLGDCKTVENPRTQRCMEMCFVTTPKRPKGAWRFKKGSSRVCRVPRKSS